MYITCSNYVQINMQNELTGLILFIANEGKILYMYNFDMHK